MLLPDGLSRGQLFKKLYNLGPYIREEKCGKDRFFFDCLAVCTNIKPAPDMREFWGWWLELKANHDHFTVEHWFGIFNKQNEWKPAIIKDKESNLRVEETFRCFYQRLEEVMAELNLKLLSINEADSLIKSE